MKVGVFLCSDLNLNELMTDVKKQRQVFNSRTDSAADWSVSAP